MRSTLLVASLVVLSLPALALAGAKRCPGGRFLVEGTTVPVEELVLEGHRVSIPTSCPPVRARLKASRKGMAIRAAWSACDVAGTVRLKARLDRACWRMSGMLKVDGARRHFTAVRLPVCGNDVREGDEACDDGNGAGGDCCSAECRIEDAPECAPVACTGNGDCAEGSYCQKRLGACDGEGVCRERPQACVGVLEPVCGCDGRTYVNACEAARAGKTVVAQGHCRKRCGTIAGLRCPDGEFCDFPPGTCGGADLEGMCVPVPETCPRDHRPVCGCDRVTYPNDCARRAAGVSRSHEGPCSCAPILCEPGTVPRDTNGDRCPDTCVPEDGCRSTADCAEGSFCGAPPGHCEAPGICVERPEACPRHVDPVCGCDRQTYPNACAAAGAGVRVARPGPCLCITVLCSPGTVPVDRDGDGCFEDCRVPCDDVCDCYARPLLGAPVPCLGLCPTCGSYWACEEGYCDARCGPVPLPFPECPAPQPCRTNEACGEGEYCHRPAGACDGVGECRSREHCLTVREPVCGCDGKTYEHACEAAKAGVSVASRGPCPERCGTIAGIPCPEGRFCEFPPGTCDGADLEGVCVDTSPACPLVHAPVCGCDGKTYGNDCERRAVGAQKAHDGACDGFCTSNHDCGAESWCAAPPGECFAAGTCEPRPLGCPDVVRPVCGCDGHTYGNACEAAAAGVRVARDGECVACDDACDCHGLPFRAPCPLACVQCGSYWSCEAGRCVERCGLVPPDRCGVLR